MKVGAANRYFAYSTKLSHIDILGEIMFPNDPKFFYQTLFKIYRTAMNKIEIDQNAMYYIF